MKTYNPKKVSVSFRGRLLTGFAPGTFIAAARNGDSFAVEVGADGEAARVAFQDFSGTIKLTLQQTSAANDLLSNFLETDELSNTGTGVLFVKDASGRTLLSCPEAWIKKPADSELAKDLGSREWTFEAALIRIFNGGN